MKLSDYIIQYRRAHNLSARKFATMCGLSNAYISLIENENTKSPTLDAIKKIAIATNIDLDELIKLLDDDTIININSKLNKNDNVYLNDKPNIKELMEKLPNKAMIKMYDKTKDLTEEEVEQVLQIIDIFLNKKK